MLQGLAACSLAFDAATHPSIIRDADSQPNAAIWYQLAFGDHPEYRMAVRFSWDHQKAAGNLRKHNVSFREAASVFADPFSMTIPDADHSMVEARFVLIGVSVWQRVLVVAHAECGDDIRIISARLATRRERTTYEEGH